MPASPINQLADGWQLKVEWFVPTPELRERRTPASYEAWRDRIC
jgi:hypothetical protein